MAKDRLCPDSEKGKSMITENFPGFFYAIFLLWFMGFLFRKIFFKSETNFLGFAQWAVDFGLGAGIVTFWLVFLHPLLGKIYFQSVFYLLFVLAIYLIYRDGKSWISKIHFHETSPLFHRSWDGYQLILWIFLLCLIWSVWMNAYYGPMEWDSWYIYGMHAKSFYFDRVIKPEFMFDLGRHIFSVVDYRLILPVCESWIFYMIGGTWDNSYGFLTAFYYMALLSLFYCGLKQYIPKIMSLLLTVLVGATTQALHLGATGMADLVLAFYILGGMIFLYQWMTTHSKSMILLSALFFLFGAMTKAEGISMVVMATAIFLIYAIFVSKEYRKTNLQHAGLYLGVLLIGFLPWLFVYLKSLQLHHYREPYALDHLDVLISRTQLIIDALTKEWFDIDNWGYLWVFVMFGFFYAIVQWSKNRKSESWILWAIILAQGFSYFLIHLTHPGDLIYFLSKTPYRLLFHLTPALVFTCMIQWNGNKIES